MNNLAIQYEEKVAKLGAIALTMPQVECPIIHKFEDGVYIREAHFKAGSLIIGHYHKEPHLNRFVSGSCVMIKEDGTMEELQAPLEYYASSGRKVAYFYEDSIWQNVYYTNEQDIIKLEETYLDKEASPWNTQPILLEDDSLVEEDKKDFLEAIALLGFTEEQVWQMSTQETDLIPFPHGEYPIVKAPSKRHGIGMFASAPIEVGSYIAPVRLNNKRTPAGRYINHSILPNTEVRMNSEGDCFLFALEDIKGSVGGVLGDEITLDYYNTFIDTRY